MSLMQTRRPSRWDDEGYRRRSTTDFSVDDQPSGSRSRQRVRANDNNGAGPSGGDRGFRGLRLPRRQGQAGIGGGRGAEPIDLTLESSDEDEPVVVRANIVQRAERPAQRGVSAVETPPRRTRGFHTEDIDAAMRGELFDHCRQRTLR